MSRNVMTTPNQYTAAELNCTRSYFGLRSDFEPIMKYVDSQFAEILEYVSSSFSAL